MVTEPLTELIASVVPCMLLNGFFNDDLDIGRTAGGVSCTGWLAFCR